MWHTHTQSVNLFSVLPTELTGPRGTEIGEHIGREKEKDGWIEAWNDEEIYSETEMEWWWTDGEIEVERVSVSVTELMVSARLC